MVGTEFDKIFEAKQDETYSDFINPAKKKRLFKEALILAIEEKYRQKDEQKEYDEITAVTKTEEVITVPSTTSNNVNTVGTTAPVITNYQHLLAVKSKYTVALPLTITAVSRSTPIIITVSERNNLRSTEQLVIASVLGNTNANGIHYIKKISGKRFELYSDKKLLTAIASNAQYISGGAISRIYYNYCKPFYSDRKIASFGKPSLRYPKFEIADSQIKFYPTDEIVQEITIDYITKAIVFIEPENGTIDLEDTYPIKFLYHVMNVGTRLVAEWYRDTELLQTSTLETQLNS